MYKLRTILFVANIIFFIGFIISWMAPLLRSGLLPFFGGTEITLIQGIVELWQHSFVLAGIVFIFAIITPTIKTLWLGAILYGYAHKNALPILSILGKLAMSDVFLIALYVIAAKGVGLGWVEPAWGLYVFTLCVLGSFTLTLVTKSFLRT